VSPLGLAVQNGDKNIVRMLLSTGKVDVRTVRPPILSGLKLATVDPAIAKMLRDATKQVEY
jgi:hypothetical protein